MDDLTAWLRGVLDEDEQTAAHMSPSDTDVPLGPSGKLWLRQAADVAAKRAILDLAERRSAERAEWFDPSDSPVKALHVDDLGAVVEHIATAYAHRPGYREEWRP